MLAGTTGCELQKCDVTTTNDAGATTTKSGVCAKSLKKWVGTPRNKTAQWASGGSLTIDGFNGPITVVKGSGTTVSVTFTPVDLRAYDTKEADIQADFAALATDATADANGNVSIKTYQNGSAHSGLGAEIRVALPDTFDGALSVTQHNGDTSLPFTGSASSLTVSSHNGDVSGSAGVPGAQGGKVTTGNGSISMSFDGTQQFNVQASALAGGKVDVGNAESAGCTIVAGGSDAAQTVSCGGATDADPTYVLQADGTGLADVTLSF
jgi:hypothetical protein